MTNRAGGWLAQAERDLEQAEDSRAVSNSHPEGAPFERYGPLQSEASDMPVRSSASSVLRWPDPTAVDEAVRRWANDLRAYRPEVEAIGSFGRELRWATVT